MDEPTHFQDEETPHLTLCGGAWSSIVMTLHKPRCAACVDIHATAGWVFPLPAVVA